MKAVSTSSGISFLVNCLAYENGTAYNEETYEAPRSTARIYDSIYVRHWDAYLTPRRYAVFSGKLALSGGQYNISQRPVNLLKGLSGYTRPESPVQPFGGAGDYDISADGTTAAFLSKAPELPAANYTTSYIYLVPADGSKVAQPINKQNGPGVPPNARGASAGPTFSPDGSQIAYFQMDGESYESDKNKLYVANTSGHLNITVIAEDWDRTPDQLAWANDAQSIYVAAPDLGYERIFNIPLNAPSTYTPTNLTNEGVVAAFYILPNDDLLISDSRIYSSRDIYTLSSSGATNELLAAYKIDAGLSGLGPHTRGEFYFQGNQTSVQSWIVYPSNFDPSKKYPLAFLVHGGPQGGWYDNWSTRWNPAVWADQGYVAIMPNPTASTGWGQAFQDGVTNQWGGIPYYDLVACWDYVDQTFAFIDTANGIEAGASYGGYMTNWIQGHELGRRFKALVTHDGVANTLADYGTEELWFIQHDFNGTLWDNRDNYERWNPLNYIHEWATPHFVVHGELDYRLPVSEAIQMFNILQERGVPSRFLNFPDENHWVLKRENSIVWHTEIYKWINYYSGVSNASSPY